MSFVSRGFAGRRRAAPPGRLPPGQYDVGDGFPVLSAGPTPRTSLASWDFRVRGQVDEVRRWSWTEFQGLPRESVSVDVHCVTSWSKFDTRWEGVSVDTLLGHHRATGGARPVRLLYSARTVEVPRSLRSTLVWGHSHYVVFAAVGALGAGIQVVVDTLSHGAHVTPIFAAFTVGIPVAVFLLILGLLNTRVKP